MRSVISGDTELQHSLRDAQVAYPELGGVAYALKGIADRCVAALALLLLAVPMLVVAILIKLSSPGPVFVSQPRVGRYGRRFSFWKFRSMRQDAEDLRDDLEEHNDHDVPMIFKIRQDPRITPLGSILRRTSIDELPNLFNVLRGEMSLVGPRPPLEREVAHYDAKHMQRLAATPGITGLWQVSGRSEVGFEEMVEMDLDYIRRWSPWLDVYILLKTPLAVLSGRGAW
ncbi:MAG TPA: sugar transferase [Dehalococcoidia bacterium]|nr:sugar transferase [Dehalococcoidia bacterium]